MNLLKNCQIDWVLVSDAAASNTDANSSILDMLGWDGVMFLVAITDSAATGVATLNLQESAANSDSAMATKATATATSVSNDDLNSMLLIVDVYRPLLRYVQGNITSATANIAFSDMFAIRYCGKKAPITQSTTTVAASTQAAGV